MRVDEFVERFLFLPVFLKGGTTYHSTLRQACGTIGKRVETLCAQVIIRFSL